MKKLITLLLITSSITCFAQKKEEPKDSVLSYKPNKLQMELLIELSKRKAEIEQETIKSIFLMIGYKPEELEGEPAWNGEKFIFKLKKK